MKLKINILTLQIAKMYVSIEVDDVDYCLLTIIIYYIFSKLILNKNIIVFILFYGFTVKP